MWKPVINQFGEITGVSVRKMSNNYPTQYSHLLIKVETPKLARAESSSLSAGCWGFFHSAGCPPLPAVGLLQAAFCWPAAFFHTSAVCEESCVFIPPSSSLPPAMPSTHPQRRRRRLVTVAISEKPKLALLAVHRWQRHFAFLLIRKQNNMIKCSLSGGEWTNVLHK